MKITVIRRWLTPESTSGELYVNGIYECFTLEDAVHDGPKIPGRTAIPEGEYPVKITFSPRFQKYMPELLNVPGFSGIRIHSGNSAADTEGCILVGLTRGQNWIGESRTAYRGLIEKLRIADEAGEKITIKIETRAA